MPIPPPPPTVQVKNAGTLVGTRRGINFLAGTGITRTITDDAANNEVEVTLAQDLPTEASVRAYHDATQSLTSATPTALAFNSERYDTDTYHDISTNNSRLTVPANRAGKYEIFGSVEIASNATGYRALSIRLNGSGIIIGAQVMPAVNGDNTGISVSTTYDLAVGDYVQLYAYQNSGSSQNVVVGSRNSPEFGMSRVGGVLASGGSASAAHVARVANQAITTATDTQISFDTETRDDGGYWASGSPTRLTVPATGWYNLAGYIIWEANTTGIRYGWLRQNGTTAVAYVSNGPHATNGHCRQTLAVNLYLTAADYIELQCHHDRGSNLNATGVLSVAKIGLG
jgi:hypothetical protein